MKCVVQKVKNKEYDMMILDDKVLYSDSANLRNFALDLKFNFFEDIKSYFIDFNKYISTNDLNFHDKNIIKDGSFNENEMYGLPYEFDFDVLYYHKNNSDYKNFLSEKIISDIKIDTNVILNSNETLELNKTDDDDNNKLSIALGEYDELLNFYIEYVAYHYGIPKTDDPDYFNIFYKNNPKNLYQSFRNYLISSAGADLNKVLKVKMQDAYNSFINDKKKLYKGKASQYKFLKNKNDTLIQSLPNNYSVVNEKYLVINNGTSKDISFLTNIAFQLTSRDIQIYRAQNMGTIPTFDMSQAPTDQYINSYCQTEPEICELIKNLNGIQIKDMFKKDEYSASFFESRILIPVALRKFVYENDDTDLIQAYKINLEINSVKAPRYFVKHMFYIYGIISFFMVAMMLVIILVHKNRKHPYIKQISPNLSNLIILGMIIDIGLPMYYDIMYVVNIDGKIYQMSYFIIDSITRNLMFLPMFSIVYRIYYIYNNRYKINFGNKLKERRFIIYVIIILCLEVTCWVFYSIYTKKVYSSNGDLISTRDIDYYLDYAFSVLFHTIYVYVYYFVIIVLIFALIGESGQMRKIYGGIKYIIIVVIFIVIFYIRIDLYTTLSFELSVKTIISFVIYLLGYILSLYLLVGYKLLYIFFHSNKHHSLDNYNQDINIPQNAINITDFNDFRKKKNKHFSLFTKKKSWDSANNDDDFDDYEKFIDNDPNNYFFNIGLEKLEQTNTPIRHQY